MFLKTPGQKPEAMVMNGIKFMQITCTCPRLGDGAVTPCVGTRDQGPVRGSLPDSLPTWNQNDVQQIEFLQAFGFQVFIMRWERYLLKISPTNLASFTTMTGVIFKNVSVSLCGLYFVQKCIQLFFYLENLTPFSRNHL